MIALHKIEYLSKQEGRKNSEGTSHPGSVFTGELDFYYPWEKE